MQAIRVFISSVQAEFAEERKLLADYIRTDALLGKFFEPFIFEATPAVKHSAKTLYLEEVDQCDIYLGLLGKFYGNADARGISPTEREYNRAKKLHKTRLVFLKSMPARERQQKQRAFVKKIESEVVRKSFSEFSDLKAAVYASLIRYLEENEYIRHSPFDATLNPAAKMSDIDSERVSRFVSVARSKRAFPLPEGSSVKTVLTHLNLMVDSRLTNAAILLFGKAPQKFFPTSEVKCAHFHGTEITKPIPSYQVYKGDVFELVSQATDFVLSKINATTGERSHGVSVDVNYELPVPAVAEAIVNAVAHRDYTGNASVQVMLFRDRLEIWNPGRLPFGLTPAKLKLPHTSIPTNPLLAEPMYLAGAIERMGTGTGDIIRQCSELGLKAPEFIQNEEFKVVIYRPKPLRKRAEEQQPSSEECGKKCGKKCGKTDDFTTPQNRKKIKDYLKKHPTATVGILEEITGLSRRGVEKNLRLLKSSGELQRIGSARNGQWKVTRKPASQ